MQATSPESFSPAPQSRRVSVLACAHCGTTVTGSESESGTGTEAADPELVFCCSGCRAVHEAIHAAGLQAFYREREPLPGKQVRIPATNKDYAELDSPTLAQIEHPDGSVSAELYIEGIHCAACVWLLENVSRVAPGVLRARLDFGRSLLDVRWDPSRTTLAAIARAVESLGYAPHAPGQREAAATGVERALLVRLGIAGAIAGNVMLMALALYSGADAGLDGAYASLFRWGSFFLALPSVFYCAAVFYRGAWAAVRTRTPNMDLPISIGISVGFVSGALNTLRGRGEIYFDTIATLIFLLLVGRWLTARQHRRAATAADFAQALAPSTARIVDEGGTREVRADAVVPGVLVEVRASERIPIDGRIELGESSIDARLLTGESAPLEAKPGDRVYAGTENVAATIRVRAEKTGQQTRVGQLIRIMEHAQRERAPIVRAADRIAGHFVLAVLSLAAVTVAIWWATDPALAIDHAVALLVVTCPCALGMATPLAVSVALSRAARRGILLKNGEVLEALARPAELIFDKSGTLTAGRPELVVWEGSSALGRRASIAEKGCDHPLARAFQRAFPTQGLEEPESVQRTNGGGVRATVQGHELVVGKPELLEAMAVPVPGEWRERAHAHAANGLTPVLIAEDGQVCGLAAFGDALRQDAASSLRALADLGYPISVLSGDHSLVVERVCGALPVVRARGGASPEDKLEEVHARLREGRHVVMIGDGMNDAAAMSAATVGFAVHGGAETSLLAASGFATEPGVKPVLEAIRGARETLRVIHRGIAFSLGYNVIGVVLAMSGVLSPLVAAIMMPLSSLTVVTSALRSRAFASRAPRASEQP